jgi:hypothetical protein
MALRPVPGATAAALLEAEYFSTKPRVDLRIMTHAVAVALTVRRGAASTATSFTCVRPSACLIAPRSKLAVRPLCVQTEAKVKARIKTLLSTPGFIGALAADAATFKDDHAVAN